MYKNNPLAPPWLWSDTSCPPDGVANTYYQYIIRQDVGANELLSDQPFNFDGDSCFDMRLQAVAKTGGDFYVQLRDELGRYMQNQPVRMPGLAGGAGAHLPVVPVQVVPKGVIWSFTVQNTIGVAGTLFLVLIGVKRRGGA